MNKKKLLAKLEDEIQKLIAYLESIPESAYPERGAVLGQICGLLTAKSIAYNLEEIV